MAFYNKGLGVYQDLKKQAKNNFEADARMEEAAKGVQSVAVSLNTEPHR